MVWVGSDLNEPPVPTPLVWSGTPSARPGCSGVHLALSTCFLFAFDQVVI